MLFSNRILSAVGGVFFLTLMISSFVNLTFTFETVWKAIAALGAACCVVLLLVHWTCRRISPKIFLIVFISLGFAVRMTWIIWNPTKPESDFLLMYNAALMAVSGDFSFGNSAYFTSFPYQFGFTMYEALIIKLFGNSIFVLKFLNILFSVGSAVILYYSASKAFNETCGRIAMLIYLFYIPNIIMCSVLTNQHISIFFFLLGCFLLLKRPHSILIGLFAGFAFSVGNLMRPIGIVYLAAIVLFFVPILWGQWRTSPKKQGIAAASRLAGVIAVFYLVQHLVSFSLISSGVTSNSLFGGDKYWKFMVGLNAETIGGWNLDDARYANQYSFGDERHQAELARIKERLEHKPEVVLLMGKKLVAMWGAPDSSAFWSLQGLDKGKLERLLKKWESPIYVLISMFGLVAMIALWRSRNYGDHLFYVSLLLMYAGAHLIIEIQTRYRLDLIPVMILLQSYGVYKCYEWVREVRIPLASKLKKTTEEQVHA